MHNIFFLLVIIFIITGCQTEKEKLYKKLSQQDKNITEYKGHYKEIKNPNINNKKEEIGLASWYGRKHLLKKSFHGKKTANGDKFNTETLTAAHRTLPLPSIAKITNLENNKSVIVMINDRGPYHKKRIIDVSSKVASFLDFKLKGVAKVKVEPLEKETTLLHEKLSINPKDKKKTKGKIKEPKCSVNCFIKLLNIERGIKIN